MHALEVLAETGRKRDDRQVCLLEVLFVSREGTGKFVSKRSDIQGRVVSF